MPSEIAIALGSGILGIGSLGSIIHILRRQDSDIKSKQDKSACLPMHAAIMNSLEKGEKKMDKLETTVNDFNKELGELSGFIKGLKL